MKTGNYYCTWDSQDRYAKQYGIKDCRSAMSEEFLLSDKGVLKNHFKNSREDLIVVIDDGWDVPYDAISFDFKTFGSLDLSEERFPSFKGTPEEKLKALSDKIKDLGYKGLGIWVCINCVTEEEDNRFDEAYARKYWEERANWCKYADVKYLKIDWGIYGRDPEYRALVTESVRKVNPDIMIEHALPFDAYNVGMNEEESEKIPKILKCSDFYRTYDVLEGLELSVTLARVYGIVNLSEDKASTPCILNVENELKLGATLNSSVGVMSHPLWNNDVENHTKACTEWHKVSPPVPLTNVRFSEEKLTDSKNYSYLKEGHWLYNSMYGKEIGISAPAVIAVNTDLPKVTYMEDNPFIIASENAESGAVSIGFLKRTYNNECGFIKRIDAEISNANNAPLGVFGEFKTLSVNYGKEFSKVTLRNLVTGESADITALVTVNKNTLQLEFAKIEEFVTCGFEITVK